MFLGHTDLVSGIGLKKTRKRYVQSCQITLPQKSCNPDVTVKYPVYYRLERVCV